MKNKKNLKITIKPKMKNWQDLEISKLNQYIKNCILRNFKMRKLVKKSNRIKKMLLKFWKRKKLLK